MLFDSKCYFISHIDKASMFIEFGTNPRFPSFCSAYYKNPSIYNIIRWFAGLMGQTTCQPLMFQVLFIFHKILQNSLQKPSQFFYKITKIKIKHFECPKSIRNYEKNYWKVRCLVNESAQQTSISYCRLSDFYSCS